MAVKKLTDEQCCDVSCNMQTAFLDIIDTILPLIDDAEQQVSIVQTAFIMAINQHITNHYERSDHMQVGKLFCTALHTALKQDWAELAKVAEGGGLQ